MRWIRSTAVMLLASLSVPAFSLGDPFDAKRVPADAKWLIHIDMDVARDTKTWDALYTKLINNDDFQTKVGQIEQVTNSTFPRDMHDITIYGRAVGDEAGVVILHAKMDRLRTVGFLQMNATYTENNYGDYKISAWQDKEKKLYAAFHDDSTVIVGRSPENVQAGLDVIDGKSESIKGGELAAGARPQLLAYFAVKDLSQLKKADEAQSPIIKQIQSGWVALSENEGNAVLQANIAAHTADTASKVHDTIDGIKAFVSLAGSDANADAKAKMAANALKNFHASQTDKVVTVEWPIPLDQVTDFIAKLPMNGQSANP